MLGETLNVYILIHTVIDTAYDAIFYNTTNISFFMDRRGRNSQ